MPEAGSVVACGSLAVLSASIAGMGWLAMSMPAHARQIWGSARPPIGALVLRGIGATSLMLALALCLYLDHASIAVLVWVMAASVAGMVVALLLAWRPHWLRLLAPWPGRCAGGGGRD